MLIYSKINLLCGLIDSQEVVDYIGALGNLERDYLIATKKLLEKEYRIK